MIQVRHHDAGRVVALERILLGKAVVEDASEGVEIGALIQRTAFKLLRSEEVDRAENRISMIDRLDSWLDGELGESEIDDLDLKASSGKPANHEVRWFDIAVEHADCLSRGEPVKALLGEVDEIAFGEGTSGHGFIEGFPVDIFHHDKAAVLVHPGVVDADDIRVGDGGHQGCLLGEKLIGRFIKLRLVWGEQALECDDPAQLVIIGAVDGAHPALPDLSSNFVSLFHPSSEEAAGSPTERISQIMGFAQEKTDQKKAPSVTS